MTELEDDFCPECRIGLSTQEKLMKFCQNCKHYWGEDDEHLKKYCTNGMHYGVGMSGNCPECGGEL